MRVWYTSRGIPLKNYYGGWASEAAADGCVWGIDGMGCCVDVGQWTTGTACAATLLACIQVTEAGSADTLRGTLKEFEAIIAAVIGGVLLTGGYGTVVGAILGALIFGFVQMGIFYTGIDTDWFKLFMGAMMVIAVLFNSYVRNRAMRSS